VAANNNIGEATVSDMATPGIQIGVAPDNQNHDPTVPQQWSFLKSTTCEHSTRYTAQQTHESFRKKEAGEATATNEESNIHKKVMQAIRKHARANVATKKHEATKRCVNDGKHASWQTVSSCCDGDLCKPGVPAKTKPRSTTETSGAKKGKVPSGDRVGESPNNAARTSFARVLVQLDIRAILIENTKLQLREKLKAFHTKDNVKNEENMHISKKSTTNIAFDTAIDVNKMRLEHSSNPVLQKDDTTELISKRVDSEEKQTEKSSKQVSLEQKGKLSGRTARNTRKNKLLMIELVLIQQQSNILPTSMAVWTRKRLLMKAPVKCLSLIQISIILGTTLKVHFKLIKYGLCMMKKMVCLVTML
jgi:hypothetical protein